MSSNLGGLIEMVFVFSLAIGWGVFELVRLHRLPKPRKREPSKGPDQGS